MRALVIEKGIAMKMIVIGLLALAFAAPALAGKSVVTMPKSCADLKAELDARQAKGSRYETRIVSNGQVNGYKVVGVCTAESQKIVLVPKALDSPAAQPAALKAGTYTGRVKFWDWGAGSGFITPDNGGADVYVHHSALQMMGAKSLSVGQQVKFDVVVGPKGPQAANVRRQ